MRPTRYAATATATAAATMLAGVALAQDAGPPAGTEADTEYAALIWEVMQQSGLAGGGGVQSIPYPGESPHGAMLETFYTAGTVEGRSGALVVKRNYGPADVTAREVLEAPSDHLASVTIMFRRAEGYDPANGDWFYAKYGPDGSLDTDPTGMPLAGRVGKGQQAGCIPCHADAGGGDFLFTTDADLPDG